MIPGHSTTVHHPEDDYLFGVETIHNLVREETAIDVINNIHHGAFAHPEASIHTALEGQVVLTR